MVIRDKKRWLEAKYVAGKRLDPPATPTFRKQSNFHFCNGLSLIVLNYENKTAGASKLINDMAK